MKTVDQIKLTEDLDARVLNAASLLEMELRNNASESDKTLSLGELVQQFPNFAGNDEYPDDEDSEDDSLVPQSNILSHVNFALGVRNAIAHWDFNHIPTEVDKEKAAKHLLQAIHRVRGESEYNNDKTILAYQKANTFEHKQAQSALKSFHGTRYILCLIRVIVVPVALIPLVYMLGMFLSWELPLVGILSPSEFVTPIVSLLSILNAVHAAALVFHTYISKKTYYLLPGSRYENGDHRCIYCGHRGKQGRGIYANTPYKSLYKLFDCSICGSTLYARSTSVLSLFKAY